MEKEKSFAMELLEDFKKQNKRMFIIIILLIASLIGETIYVFYLLNDIGTIEETSSQEISDVDTIENSNVINGDMYGENKTNKKD